MNRLSWTVGLAVFASVTLSGTPAQASFHLWDITEVFTNSDGSVQFIELFTTSPFETALNGHQIQATSDGNTKTFVYDANLSESTASRHLLIATEGFSDLTGGVAPDYTFLSSTVPLFDPDAASITINMVGADSLTFAGSLLPKDGVNSLIDNNPSGTPNLVTGTNSPTNFDGTSGSVDLSAALPTGDYNGDGVVDAADYTVWRDAQEAGAMTLLNRDPSKSGLVDEDDYMSWRDNFGMTLGSGAGGAASSLVPEPATLSFAWVLLLPLLVARPRRQRG